MDDITRKIAFKLAKLADELDDAGFHSEASDVDNVLSKVARESDPGGYIFPKTHKKVTDNKDHYPIGDESHAHNALSQASKHSKVPDWYNGTLDELVHSIQRAVHKKYPSIKVTKKSKNPHKG